MSEVNTYPWQIFPVERRDVDYPFDYDSAIMNFKPNLPEEIFTEMVGGECIDATKTKWIKESEDFYRKNRNLMTRDIHTPTSDDDYYWARSDFLKNILLNTRVCKYPIYNRYDLEDVAFFMHYYGFKKKTPSGIEKNPRFRISSRSNRCIEVDHTIPNFSSTKDILNTKFNNITVEPIGTKHRKNPEWKTRICVIDYKIDG